MKEKSILDIMKCDRAGDHAVLFCVWLEKYRCGHYINGIVCLARRNYDAGWQKIML